MTPEVDLVVNTWERSYRSVLQPGFFYSIKERNLMNILIIMFFLFAMDINWFGYV
jgi:hypothetical protein